MSAESDAELAAALDAAILAGITEPAEGTVDGMTFKKQRLSDLIAAKKALGTVAATASPGRGIRFTQLKPPGAV